MKQQLDSAKHDPSKKGAEKGGEAGADGNTTPSAKPTKISNVVTKFSFATKGGIAAHNPYKTN